MQIREIKHELHHSLRILFVGMITFFLWTTLNSCDNQHCDEPMYSPIGITCLSEINKTEKYSLYRLSLLPIDADTIMANISSEQFFIPLNPSASQTRYVWCVMPRDYTTIEVSTDTIWEDEDNFEVLYNIGEQSSLTLVKQIDDLLCFSDNSLYYLYDGTFVKPVIDTLNISYSPIHEFISGECGYRTSYELNNVAFSHGFGDVEIESNLITNKNKENHVNIYLSIY